MWKKALVIFCLLFLFGCDGLYKNDATVSIDYPVTNISVLDNEISSYVNKTYRRFKGYENGSKLNISYTYKELNEDVVNINLNSEITTDKTFHKIKTYTYNKKTGDFLTMEDLVRDVDSLSYDIKAKLIQKYSDVDIDYLNNVSLDVYKFDDDNLTLFFNSKVLKNNDDIVYLDVPLNSLDMIVETNNELYFSLKKKSVDLDDKVVALTFDDGPSKYTNSVLDVLKKHKACATFFVVGHNSYFKGDILRRMLKEGSEIGNHSFDHKVLTNMSEDEFKEEVNKTQNVIRDLTGYSPTLFRPTYGGYTNVLKGYTDLYFVLWDVDSRDWKVKSKDKIINNVIPYVKSGSIVLFHDNHEYALNALEDIILDLKDKGYKFVTVSELIEFMKMREEA